MFGESISESPRLPSPWDSRLLTPTGTKTPSSSYIATAGHTQPGNPHHSLIPEEDLSGHIEYKLRLPAHPSADRLARLTSQLKWRLLEGGGVSPVLDCDSEAIYELGVCDNGLLLGIDSDEIATSLHTLEQMAEGLGAQVKVVRRIEVTAEGIKELSNEEAPWIQQPMSIKTEAPIRIAVVQPRAVVKVDEPTGIPSLDIASIPSLSLIDKTRLTKKDRRFKKREREAFLKAASKISSKLPAVDEDDTGFLVFDEPREIQGTSAEQSLSSSTYISSTPSVDDLPSLSHSPSPPSSVTDSLSSTSVHAAVRCTFTRFQNTEIGSNNTSQSMTVSTTTSLARLDPNKPPSYASLSKPTCNETLDEEQARHTLRRHLRKQWKREKQQQKQLERVQQQALDNSHYSRRCRNHNGHFTSSILVPHDQYLDGLAALFGESTLHSEQRDDNTLAVDEMGMEEAGDEPRQYAHETDQPRRRRRKGAAFSPTSTPLSDVEASAIVSPSDTAMIKPLPVVNASAGESSSRGAAGALAKLRKKETERYAVECVISMPGHSSSDMEGYSDTGENENAEDGEDGEDENIENSVDKLQSNDSYSREHDTRAMQESVSACGGKIKEPKASRPSKDRSRLQSFIDFETVWDELEMDL